MSVLGIVSAVVFVGLAALLVYKIKQKQDAKKEDEPSQVSPVKEETPVKETKGKADPKVKPAKEPKASSKSEDKGKEKAKKPAAKSKK